MIKQIKIGQKDIHFARIGGKVIYPNYVAKDNLVLWYDFSGRTNLDVKKGIAEDLSGNGNDGILENFAYESGSGYDSNSYLEFDNVDDFITIPELNLDVNDFTVLINGEILSYRGDNVAKMNVNELENGGRNLLTDEKRQAIYKENGTLGTLTINHAECPHGFYMANDSSISQYFRIDDLFKTSGVYTLSFEFRGSQGTAANTRVFIGDSQSPIFRGNAQNDWLKFSFTATIEDLDNKNYIKFYPGWIYAYFRNIKLEKGNKPTDWSPAPEDFQTIRITPIFSNKIKTLMYWNRALTDVELQEVYNVQKHRI